MPQNSFKIIRRALQITQNKNYPLYVFCLTGEELLSIAEISRISRDDDGKLIGYQREEVKSHINGIVEYLDSEDSLLPNPIILALSSRVKFKSSRGPNVADGLSIAGLLEIPVPQSGEKKPAWIVDGQQRALAISISKRKNIPIPVNAFVADDVDIQRKQFILVNNTKPISRGLINELLPEVDNSSLPGNLSARKIPSALCEWLNNHPNSPFQGIIIRASTSTEDKKNRVVTDTALIKTIQESFSSPSGCLFPYRNMATGETDFDSICQILVTYWTAVKNTFPEAWGLTPTKSRLMHGAGIHAMGRIMDKVMTGFSLKDSDLVNKVEKELHLIAPFCRWTSGNWEELGNISWSNIQNTPRDIRLLSNYLIRTFVQESHKP
ncbi:MAG: DGQHR domain-containing protein [SAR324 cluster bacterium]|nr:DGQHR domain-containing protein [SAR324 cluster bacterium]